MLGDCARSTRTGCEIDSEDVRASLDDPGELKDHARQGDLVGRGRCVSGNWLTS